MKRILLALAIGLSSSASFAASLQPFNLPWKNTNPRDAVYKSSDHPNAVFVLEFFANFCGACNENAENVDALKTAYQNNDRVQVLDVSLDSQEREIQAWIQHHSPNHPVVQDTGRGLWRQLNEQYIPTAVVLDCKGEIKWRHTGTWERSDIEEIKNVVDGLLAQTCN